MGYHPETEQILKNAGIKDHRNHPWMSLLADFRQMCENAGNKPTFKVQSFYRVRDGDKEFLVFHRNWTGKNHFGKKIEAYEPSVGELEKPLIEWDVDPSNGKRVNAQISEWEISYDTPFSKEVVDKLLKEGAIKNPHFYLKDGGFKVAVSYEEFVHGNFGNIMAGARQAVVKVKEAQSGAPAGAAAPRA